MQILLVFSEVSGISSIPEFGWIYPFAGRVPHLIVDVVIAGFDICKLYAGVAHRADQLTRHNRIAYRDTPRMSMKYFVSKAIRVPYDYSTGSTAAGVCYNASHRRTEFRVSQITRSSLPADIVEIDADMRRRSFGPLDSVETGVMG